MMLVNLVIIHQNRYILIIDNMKIRLSMNS